MLRGDLVEKRRSFFGGEVGEVCRAPVACAGIECGQSAGGQRTRVAELRLDEGADAQTPRSGDLFVTGGDQLVEYCAEGALHSKVVLDVLPRIRPERIQSNSWSRFFFMWSAT